MYFLLFSSKMIRLKNKPLILSIFITESFDLSFIKRLTSYGFTARTQMQQKTTTKYIL